MSGDVVDVISWLQENCAVAGQPASYLHTRPPLMRPLAPHKWLLFSQVGVGVGSVEVVSVVGLTVSLGVSSMMMLVD